MGFVSLPTDYENLSWSGKRKFNLIENDDGTVSLEDVTTYTNEDKATYNASNINKLNTAINSIDDVIIESGTVDNWKYRKYKSGIYECWRDYQASVDVSTTSGSLYRGSLGKFDFPVTFAAAPTLTAQISHTSSGLLWLAVGGSISTTSTPTYYPYRVSSGTVSVRLSLHAIGTVA